ncbi:MAG: DUF885 family protein, partial [Pseudomonadota bacterium]
MNRILPSAAALLLLASCGGRTAPPPARDYSAELKSVADDYLAAGLEHSPFSVVYAGMGDVVKEDLAAFEDNTPEGLARLQRAEDQLSVRLADIDQSALSARADAVLYDTLKEALEAAQGQRVCRLNLWGVNHMFGWQNVFPQVADAQPVETPVERAMALARWRRLPAYLKQEQANLDAGLAAGYSAPKRVVARVVTQLDSILAAPPEQSPFLSFASKAGGAENFDAAVKKLGADEITPAVAAFRDYLRDVYMPKARDALSISAVPNGEQCYEALLRTYHTAAIGGKATFERGQAAVAANKEAVIERGEAMFGETDFAAILERAKDDPANRFKSEQELIDFTRALAPVAREKIAPFFSKLPDQELGVEQFPDFLKGTGQSSRYEPKPLADGSATYLI